MSDTDEAAKTEAAAPAVRARRAPQRLPARSRRRKPLWQGERAALRAGLSGAGGARVRAAAQPPVADVRLRDGSAVRRDGHRLRRARGLGVGAAQPRPLRRLRAVRGAVAGHRQADASRARARHVRLPGARHQIPAADASQHERRAVHRRRRRAVPDAQRRRFRRHAPYRRASAAARPISSSSPSGLSVRRTCGAAARASASTAPASSS